MRIKNKDEVVLNSKFFIFIVGFIFSPLFSGVLFCQNLFKVGLKGHILGVFTLVVIGNIYISFPFLGINSKFLSLANINHLIIPIFIVEVLWNRLLEDRKYVTSFSILKFFNITMVVISYLLYQNLITNEYPFYSDKPWFYYKLSKLDQYGLLLLFLPYILIKVLFSKK